MSSENANRKAEAAWLPYWLHPLFWAAHLTLLFVAFHWLGNTVENVRSRSVFAWMIARWGDEVSFGADYSIGWIIPFVSIGVILFNRKTLLAEPRRINLLGLPLLAASLLAHWVAARAQQPRISLAALTTILWALPFLCFGWRTARHLIFPCAYLLFCIPWNFLDALTFPLRLLSSAVSAFLLRGIGIGVIRSGTLIRSVGEGSLDFNVADPCSGLSSMLALLALTTLYAYLTQHGFARRAILFLSAIPLAMIGNIFRIVTIAVVAKLFNPEVALKLYHDYSAFLVFPIAILLMLALGRFLVRYRKGMFRAWIVAHLQST